MGDLPLWGAVLIVKDEAANIERCLASAAEAGIRVITLLDTGSTDTTVELVESAAERLGLDLHVGHTEFRNFGQARSEAFALARGTCQWLCALDADMTVAIEADYVPDPTVDALMVEMGSADFSYRLPLVLAGSLPFESRGACHEYTTLPDRAYTSAPTDKVRVTLHGNRSSAAKSRWHLSLLEAEIAANPGNSRAVFYAAQTLRDLGDPRALAMYEKRIRMGGWDEEVFVSMLHYARLLPTWPAQLQALIRAWEFRPSRLEPAYEIARALNARGEHFAAYRFATVPIVVPPDNLFVETAAYRFGLDFERSIAAFYVIGKDECRAISDDLLTRAIPDHIRAQVEKNRALC